MATIAPGRTDHAARLLRAAHDAVHRYPPDFPGFTASVELTTPAARSTGRLTARPGATLQLQVEAPRADFGWAHDELSSAIDHRRHRPWVDSDGRFEVSGEEAGDRAGTVRVRLADPMSSSYVLDGDRIVEIARTRAGMRFVIAITARRHAPDGTWVATEFTVGHFGAATGDLIWAEAYHDEYVELDGLLLPSLRRVAQVKSGTVVVREVALADQAVTGAPVVTP